MSTVKSPLVPEVVEEYKLIMTNAVSVGGRRQTMNDVFVGINVVFLGAMGFVIATTHLASWWGAIAAGSIMLVVYPLNRTWYRMLGFYRKILVVHYMSLQKMEQEYMFSADINIKLADSEPERYSLVRSQAPSVAELKVAAYFLFLYPIITMVVASLTCLIANGTVAQLP